MSKLIKFNEDARQALKNGIDKAVNALKITIGPRGQNVAIGKGYGGPVITNDGVTIAKDIVLEDPFENMGAEIIKEVTSKTNDSSGDGTTTSAVLTQAIINEGMKKVELGFNVIGIKNGIEIGSKAIIESLKKLAKPIKIGDETRQVATISAESEEIGKIISEIVDEIGPTGVITVEEAQQNQGVTSESVQGMQIDRGWISPYFVTNQDKMEAELKDVAVLVTDKTIAVAQTDLVPMLETLRANGRNKVVIIADDITGDALATLILNHMRGIIGVIAIKAPGFGDRKKDFLQDIAILTGAKFISKDAGASIAQVRIEDFGSVDRVISSRDKTVLVGGRGNKEQVASRISSLKKETERIESKHDKTKVEERIAKLLGGVAVIKVGAATETAMKYLKLKVEDAVNATKAALEEGIVAGGGSALVRAAMKTEQPVMTEDEEVGFNIIMKAVEAPLKQIAINAGVGDGSIVLYKVRSLQGENSGYNAGTGKYVDDMIKEGIVDPVKVTRNALQNAASAASTLLTTQVAIAEKPKENKDNQPM